MVSTNFLSSNLRISLPGSKLGQCCLLQVRRNKQVCVQARRARPLLSLTNPAGTASLTGQWSAFKIFRMKRLGIPRDRIAKRLEQAREVVLGHLAEVLPNPLNTDLRVTFRLSQSFTIAQVAQKHGWTESGGGVEAACGMLRFHGL